MIVTLFRSTVRDEIAGTELHDEYRATNRRMVEIAGQMPGFVAAGAIKDREGETVTVVLFESEEAQQAWREHPEHREAQRRGREDWYQSYSIEVLAPVRTNTFERLAVPEEP